MDCTKLILPIVNEAWIPLTSTGVFKPATVFPTEPVNDPALDTVTFASASKSNDPIVKSSWSSAAKTVMSWSICNEKLPNVDDSCPALVTDTDTSIDATADPIAEVKPCQ